MLSTFLYQKGKPVTTDITRAQMMTTLKQKDVLLWVDLEEPTEFETETLIEIFGFHPLAVEDCVSDKSNPKIDDYEDYLFLVTHGCQITAEEALATSELDVFLGKNYVVTFRREKIRAVDQVKGLVQKKPEFYLGRGADLLFHCILDHMVDNYMPVIDRYDQNIDDLEEHIFKDPPEDYLTTVLQVKHDMFYLRRIVSPQRDAVHYLLRNPTPLIDPDNLVYFRDIYDHLLRIYSMAESHHESLSSILQAYYSYSSNKLNDVMRRMTVLATLTMPVVVIASIYGMNFKFMPTLEWPSGFYLSLLTMLAIPCAMLVWMKFKKWI
jgi:magnesium transporter